MRNAILALSIALICCSTIYAQSNKSEVFKLEKINGHYVFETQINNRIPTKILLESGIHVMLIDSLYAFENRDFINLDFVSTQGNEKMNMGGKNYDITHKSKGTVKLGNNTEYTGEIFVLSNYKSYYDIAIPIQNIRNSSDGRSIIKLDMEKHELETLTREKFKLEYQGYTTTTINYDSYMKMPAIRTKLDFEKDGKTYSLDGNFVLDLGNAAFLFLMKQSPIVQKFLIDNSDINIQKAYNKKGVIVAEAITTKRVNICNINCYNQVIGITTALPKFTTEGCLGLKFFEGMISVFDFDNSTFHTRKN